MKVSSVPIESVPALWPYASVHIDRAIQRLSADLYDIVEVYSEILLGDLVLWVVLDGRNGIVAAYTTRATQYPKEKVLCIDWLGGDGMSEWLPEVLRKLDDFARDNGCAYITASGRRGWLRELEGDGYEPWVSSFKKKVKTDG